MDALPDALETFFAYPLGNPFGLLTIILEKCDNPSMDMMLSTRQVAQKLQISSNTVKKLWREGRLRGSLISERKIRFRPEDVEDFLAVNTPRPLLSDESKGCRRSTHRLAENRWCEEHRDELLRLAGQWVVVEPAGVVSHDADPLMAFSQAKEKGILVPYIFFMDHPTPPGTVRIGL